MCNIKFKNSPFETPCIFYVTWHGLCKISGEYFGSVNSKVTLFTMSSKEKNIGIKRNIYIGPKMRRLYWDAGRFDRAAPQSVDVFMDNLRNYYLSQY